MCRLTNRDVDASGAPRHAVPLANRWDYRSGVEGGGSEIEEPSRFTFACAGYALAECVEMGYRSWATALSCVGGDCKKVSLAPLHQACTRMLRADYCGDGASFTINGTLINVYDHLGDPKRHRRVGPSKPNGVRTAPAAYAASASPESARRRAGESSSTRSAASFVISPRGHC